MDATKVKEAAEMVEHWEKALIGAQLRMAQAEADEDIAYRNLATFKERLSKLMKEDE